MDAARALFRRNPHVRPTIIVNGVECHPIVEKCEGCERTKEVDGVKYCASYPFPERKWSQKVCNFATHVKLEIDIGRQGEHQPVEGLQARRPWPVTAQLVVYKKYGRIF